MTTRLVLIPCAFFVLFSLSNCNSNPQADKQLEGDLYYDWLHLGSFYNQSDSMIKKVKLYTDTVSRASLDSGDLRFLAMYEILMKEDLLYSPFIDLKMDNDSIVKIYFTNDDYDKIKIYKRQDLLDTKKKIRIRIEVRDLGSGMALATKLLSLDKVNGQTFQVNRKLKIEDYN